MAGNDFPWVVARDSGWTRGTLSCGSGWQVCRCECAGFGQYGWVLMDCPPQWVTDEFGSLGTLRTLFVFGNSTWRYSVWSIAWFWHVLYRLWPIGVAARHIEILKRRCRTLLTWLWLCERTGRGSLIYFTIHGGGHVEGS